MKKIIAILLSLVFMLTFASCGNNLGDDSKEENREYIADSDIINFIQNPDNYKGKYVKISGKISSQIADGDEITLQIYTPYDDFNNDVLVDCSNGSETFSEDEYVIVEGKIEGSQKYESLLGEELTSPLIEAVSVQKVSYIDAISPTLKSVDVWQTVNPGNSPMTLEKVEFAEKETRLYFTFENHTGGEYDLYTYSCALVQNGNQYEQQDNFDANYPELSTDVIPEAKTSGVITFPAIDQNTDFMVRISGCAYSDFETNDFDFYVTVNQ